MPKTWLAGLITLFTLVELSSADETSQADQVNIVGCWERTTDELLGHRVLFVQFLCFEKTGWMWPGAFGVVGQWRFLDRSRLYVDLEWDGGPKQQAICSVWTDDAETFLVMTECQGQNWNGSWRRALHNIHK